MSNLVIGHVTPSTACIWVRGDNKKKKAELSYRKKGTAAWKTLIAPLEENRGYVTVFDLADLTEGTEYEVDLAFKPSGVPVVRAGAFRTAPEMPRDVSFLLASCNWTRAPLDILDPEETWNGIESLIGSLAPDFMVHCGDQIYADVPSSPLPEFMNVAYYRDLYQRAWKIKPTARVLTSLPHYMILDDHEIFDDYYNGKPYGRSAAFGGVADGQAVRGAALAAYKEYQHSHNPQPFPLPALYYEWGYGGVEFFAMDVRTERYGEPHSQMVGTVQMQALKDWLTRHAQATKFVITSVPFVGEARNAEDKWSGPAFQPQRDELVDFLAARPEIERLVFLTGDMHCSYHATMTIHRQDGTELLVHELMSSPINQFCNGFPAFLERADHRTAANTAYEVALKEEEFYGRHSNVMLVRATPRGLISWNVYRTKGVTEPPTPALPGVVPFQL